MEKSEVIFGTRAVIEAIRAGRQIEKVCVQTGLSNDLIKELINETLKHGVPLSYVPAQKLNGLSSKNHQGAVCYLSAVQYAVLENLIDKAFGEGRDPFFLIVDQVTDVRNFGGIARSAECAGADAIILSAKGNAPITSDAMKTSAGALSHVPVCRVKDMKETAELLCHSGIQLVACTEKSEQSIYDVSLAGPLAIIVGSEEFGISPWWLKKAHHCAHIPMKGKIDSLNVSVAAGIALFEAVRQRGVNG